MQEHGGRIRLESQPDAGASFFVELPVTGGQAAAGAGRARVGSRSTTRSAGASILVVEDEAALAAAVTDALRDAGYVVERAADGEEALAKVGEQAVRSGDLRSEDAAARRQGVLSHARRGERRRWRDA